MVRKTLPLQIVTLNQEFSKQVCDVAPNGRKFISRVKKKKPHIFYVYVTNIHRVLCKYLLIVLTVSKLLERNNYNKNVWKGYLRGWKEKMIEKHCFKQNKVFPCILTSACHETNLHVFSLQKFPKKWSLWNLQSASYLFFSSLKTVCKLFSVLKRKLQKKSLFPVINKHFLN